jgi:DNA-directed RNA polymerase subunit L
VDEFSLLTGFVAEHNSPDVEFCGYTIPHPSETKMNIRIQTWGELPPVPGSSANCES